MLRRTYRYMISLPEAGLTLLAEVEDRLARPALRHLHLEVQVLWVLEGGMRIETEAGDAIDLQAGGCCAVPAHLPHLVGGRNGRRPVRFLDVRLPAEPDQPLLSYVERLGVATALAAPAGEVSRAAAELRVAAATPGSRRTALVSARLWSMFALLSRNGRLDGSATGGGGDDGDDEPRITMARRFMVEHLSDPIGVIDVADAVRLSRSQLSRLFRRHDLPGPAHEQRRLRVERAAQLLAESALSVKEIAGVCGFASADHFSRGFQQVTGTSPTRHRAAGVRR